MKLIDFINKTVASGRCSFTLDEAHRAIGKSRATVINAINRLLKKAELANPARGFYVIVAPEYRVYGCLPAEFFISDLIAYWQCEYYAGLLSAALFHGASHQQPQVFQVVATKKHPGIHCGKIKIEFIYKKIIENLPTQKVSTLKNVLLISSPEVTAMDLLCYPQRCGGLNHIATVLAELHEKIEPEKLHVLLENNPELAWKQRLGYLLSLFDAENLTNIISQHLNSKHRVDYVPLLPGIELPNATHNKQWKIIENATVESDI